MNDWIPLHRSLRQGAKRGLPRAVRFVYLELAQEARPYGGALPLPSGFRSDVDAVHDILGGSRSEIAKALDVLSTPLDASDEPMITLSGPPGRRILTVNAFSRWVRLDTSTPRVRRHREKQREQSSTPTEARNALQAVSETPPETPQRREEKRRAEERREEKIVHAVAPATVSPSPPPAPARAKTPAARRAPPAGDFQLVIDRYARAYEAARGTKPAIGARTGRAAKDLLALMSAAEACAVVDAAFADDWFAKNRAELWHIAAEPNRWRASAPPPPPPEFVRPGPPPGERDMTAEEFERHTGRTLPGILRPAAGGRP